MKKVGALLLLLALAACAGEDKPDEPKADQTQTDAKAAVEKIKTDNLICPQVAILTKTEEIFDYGGEDPDPSQLVAKARMKTLTGDCAYRGDSVDGQQTGIDILFNLDMVAARGPRLGGTQFSFPYFIVVIDPADNILSREVVTAQFEFSGTDKVAEDNEPLHVFIPLPAKALQGGPDYRVLVGFQLAKKQAKAR